MPSDILYHARIRLVVQEGVLVKCDQIPILEEALVWTYHLYALSFILEVTISIWYICRADNCTVFRPSPTIVVYRDIIRQFDVVFLFCIELELAISIYVYTSILNMTIYNQIEDTQKPEIKSTL